MAEGILRARLGRDADCEVSSAGIAACTGLPPSGHSVTACAEVDADISSQVAQPLTPELLRSIDLVLSMEEHHVMAARHLDPAMGGKVHLLSRFAASDDNAPPMGVADPIGGSLDDYREALRDITQYIDRALPRIEGLIRERRAMES